MKEKKLQQTPKEQNKKIKNLFKKYKKTFGTYKSIAQFKEPICILMRTTNKADFYEDVKTGEFTFEHSDGKTRSILLTPKNIQTFDYGNSTFRGYVCHENFPLPLPQEPLATVEEINIVINKTLNDMKKWKAMERKALGDLFYKIAVGIAIIILAIVAYKLVAPNNPAQTVQTVQQVAPTIIREVAQNGTILP